VEGVKREVDDKNIPNPLASNDLSACAVNHAQSRQARWSLADFFNILA
jgi:hypothetical protein